VTHALAHPYGNVRAEESAFSMHGGGGLPDGLGAVCDFLPYVYQGL